MAAKKNSFDEPGTSGKKPQKKIVTNFWERLIGKGKEFDSEAQTGRKLPKDPDQRLRMLETEIANLANTITNSRNRFTPQEYDSLHVLQNALQEGVRNQPSFNNCDFTKIDQRLFDLCRIADESIQSGYYTAAIWSMRGLSSGLVDVRRDIAFVDQVSITGNSEKAKAIELENRENHLRKYVDIACEYSWIDKCGKELSKRTKSLDTKNTEYKEAYKELDAALQKEKGQTALKMLKENPKAATTDEDAKTLDKLIRAQTTKWVACEVEESLILDLKRALETLEGGVNTLRATLHDSVSLKNFLGEFRAELEKELNAARDNRKQLYQSIDGVQKILEEDRRQREAFERSDLFVGVTNNALRQMELQKEKEAENRRVREAIETDVKEGQRILADERRRKNEEAARLEAEAEAEAARLEAEAEKAEAARREAEAEKAEAARREAEAVKAEKMARVRIQEP